MGVLVITALIFIFIGSVLETVMPHLFDLPY
jgi:hypothetical protein